MSRASELPLGEGERIILYQQGACLSRRSWKLGHLYLTNKRLLFRQVKRLILNVPLENITAVAFHKKPFILATKTCMLLSYRDGASGRPREAVIITAHLHSWCERIAELLSEKGMELKVQGVLTEGDVVRARRDHLQEILTEIKAEEEAIAIGVKSKEEIAQVRVNRILAGGPRHQVRHIKRRSDIAQARRDRVQGKIPLGEREEVIKARLDRARDRALASIRGEATIRDFEGATPWWVSDIAQARRERVKEILAEGHGDFPERIEEEHVAKVAQALDPASAQIVWYLWKNRHAKIEELRRVLGESSHMNVLVRIREAINPTAGKILGRPILVFERARIDHTSGERILYSWWLSGDAERRPVEGERLVDIFDEGDHILVIVDLVGFEEKGIQLAVEDETLVVKAEAPGRSVHEEIPLSPQVDGQRFRARYHNNMLQVRFEKEQAR